VVVVGGGAPKFMANRILHSFCARHPNFARHAALTSTQHKTAGRPASAINNLEANRERERGECVCVLGREKSERGPERERDPISSRFKPQFYGPRL
jgi:hypothetical protein